MYKFFPHDPYGYPVKPVRFESKSDLLSISDVKKFRKSPGFSGFFILPKSNRVVGLWAEIDFGLSCWYVGCIEVPKDFNISDLQIETRKESGMTPITVFMILINRVYRVFYRIFTR